MNTYKQNIIEMASGADSPFWKRIAKDLSASTRAQREVNLSRIDRNSKEGDVVVIPGKVLGDGNITHKVTVAAYSFSKSAQVKLKQAKCETIMLPELLKKHPKGVGRIIG